MSHFRAYLAVVAAGAAAYVAVALRVDSLLAAPLCLLVAGGTVAALAVVVWSWERAGEREAVRGTNAVFMDLHEARQERARTHAAAGRRAA